jgi:hypothetical protein
MAKNTLTMEMNIVADSDKKVLFQTRVPLETLNALAKTQGERAVANGIWDMFQKLTAELRPK